MNGRGLSDAVPHECVADDLHAERFDVVSAIRAPREVGQVELDLIPALHNQYVKSAQKRF